jgi:hypothetical protein
VLRTIGLLLWSPACCLLLNMRHLLSSITILICPLLAPSPRAESSVIPQGPVYPAFVQSLSTGKYYRANVTFVSDRAEIRLEQGGRISLKLENPHLDVEEAEELIGTSGDRTDWAIYVDWPEGSISPNSRLVAHNPPLVNRNADQSRQIIGNLRSGPIAATGGTLVLSSIKKNSD